MTAVARSARRRPWARPPGSTTARSCPPTPPPTVQFVRGEGSRLWDRDGKEYLDFLAGLAVVRSATPTPRSPTPSPSRPARCCTSRTSSAPCPAPRSPSPSTACSAAAARCSSRNSGAEANECAIKLARKWGGRGRYQVDQRLRLVPRPHPRHAARHRPAPEARGVPAPARGLPPRGVERPRRARGRHRPVGRGGAARAGAGRGRGQPGHRRVLRGRAPAVRRAGPAVHGRRGPDRPRAAPASGSASSTSASSPTSSPWPRRSATACPSGRAGPGARSPPPSSPATTPRPTAASRSPRPRRGPCSRSWSARTCPQLAEHAGSRLRQPLEAAPRRGRGPGPRPPARRPSSPRASTPGSWPPTRSTPASSSTPCRPSALRLAPPLLVTDDEIDEAVAARCGPRPRSAHRPGGGRLDEAPPRDRRPQPRRAARGARRSAPRRSLPRPSTARAWPCCSRSRRLRTRNSMEMAVVQLGGHPSPSGRRGRPRHPRDGRGRHPHPAAATTPPSAPGSSSTPSSSAWPRCRACPS